MILQALAELAAAEDLCQDPDYEFKPIAWLIRLNTDGTLIGAIESTYREPPTPAGVKKKPKPVAKQFAIPRQAPSRSGTKAPAEFFIDNAKYVFGRPTADKPFPLADGAQKSAWFLEKVRACADATKDQGAAAVLTFLEEVGRGGYANILTPETKSNELFGFLLGTGNEFIHQRPTVRAYWKGLRLAPADVNGRGRHGTGDESPAIPRHCIISGQPVTHVGIFPKIDRVPGGATSGVSLVGFNAPAFESHGWDGNDNAPFSRAAAEAVSTALNRLLNPSCPKPGNPEEKLPRRRLDLGGDTVLLYWSPHAKAEETIDFFADVVAAEPEDPEKVADVFKAVWRGKPAHLDDPAAFYAITLSGAQGRAVVRDWLESTVGNVYEQLGNHFRDLAIVRNTAPAKGKPPSPAVPLRMLLDALAPPGKGSDVPAALASDFVLAAIRGTCYPLSLLQKALLRERAEAGGDEWIDSARRDARAAIIKAVLIRRFNQKVTPAMDPDNKTPGYRLGRLLAVLENTQRLALGRNLNATIKDKYYGAASATPAAVFPSMMDLFHKHCRKARDERPGAVVNREKEVDAILAGLESIPVHLDLKGQGMFVLGYHHERHALLNKPDTAVEASTPE